MMSRVVDEKRMSVFTFGDRQFRWGWDGGKKRLAGKSGIGVILVIMGDGGDLTKKK